MTTKDIILSIFEILLCAGTIWAVFNEYRFLDFEDKLKSKIKKLWEVIRW